MGDRAEAVIQLADGVLVEPGSEHQQRLRQPSVPTRWAVTDRLGVFRRRSPAPRTVAASVVTTTSDSNGMVQRISWTGARSSTLPSRALDGQGLTDRRHSGTE
jgi:hypothetical protein